MPAIRVSMPDGQHHHLVARAEHAGGHLAGVAAVVVVLVAHRAHDPLHREARVDEVAVARPRARAPGGSSSDGPVVPGHVLGAVDHVVAVERRDRDEREVVRSSSFAAQPANSARMRVEDVLGVVRRGPSC